MTQRLAAALVASVAATAGTAYFLFSDGGDVEVARARIDEVVERAQAEVKGIPTALSGAGLPVGGEGPPESDANEGFQGYPVNSMGTEQACDEPSSPKSLLAPGKNGPFGGHREGSRGPDPVLRKQEAVESSSGCHSCSGPRLWFYADKFGATRLKRRFTPYGDPSPAVDGTGDFRDKRREALKQQT